MTVTTSAVTVLLGCVVVWEVCVLFADRTEDDGRGVVVNIGLTVVVGRELVDEEVRRELVEGEIRRELVEEEV